MPPSTGPRLPTHHCGPWQSIMQSTYTTMIPMNSLVWHPSTSSLALTGLRASSMTCMFGDALCTCSTAPLLMARSSHAGSLAHVVLSTWGTHLSMPALFPWSSTLQWVLSLPPFTSSLMIGFCNSDLDNGLAAGFQLS